jgi:long-subunit acyl-CoA synthetase (AMP-forming)
LISSCREILSVFRLNQEDASISYLPYPHSFEQCVTFFSVMA